MHLDKSENSQGDFQGWWRMEGVPGDMDLSGDPSSSISVSGGAAGGLGGSPGVAPM